MLSPQVTELLTAYVDGEVTPRQRKAVTRLLRRSAEARRFLEQLETDSSELRRLPLVRLSPDFATSVLALIRQPHLAHAIRPAPAAAAAVLPIIRGVGPRRPSRLARLLKLAVAALVLVVAGFGSYALLTNLDGLEAFKQNFFANHGQQPTDNRPPQPTAPEEKMVEDQPRVGSLIHESVAMQPYGPLLPEMRTQSDMDHFLTILRPKPQPFVSARPRLMSIVPVRELDQAPGQELLKEVLQTASSRFDLFCGDSSRGLDRVQAVFAAHGVTLTISADVKTRLAKHQKPALTIYSEDLTAEELAAILRQLATDERKPNANVFDKLTLNPATPGELAKLLGGDPSHYQPTLRGPLGVDLSRPLADQTAQELTAKLEGQGGNSTDAALQPVERKAVVVLHNALQPSVPREVKQLIDGRKEWRVGNVQVVFVLWPN